MEQPILILEDKVSGRPGEWMQTYSGRQFFPLDPRPEDICITDIAHALSMTCRYAGHCQRFYSIAEHSVLMFRYGLVKSKTTSDVLLHDNLELAAVVALFHDAAEAYTGDLPRAVKQAVKDSWRPMEHKIEDAIWTHFGLQEEAVQHQQLVKTWDQMIVPTERKAFMRLEEVWAHDMLKPLPVTIYCWPPHLAKQAFILAYWEACKIMGWDPEEIET